MGFHGKKVFARNIRANTFLPLNDEVKVRLSVIFKFNAQSTFHYVIQSRKVIALISGNDLSAWNPLHRTSNYPYSTIFIYLTSKANTGVTAVSPWLEFIVSVILR